MAFDPQSEEYAPLAPADTRPRRPSRPLLPVLPPAPRRSIWRWSLIAPFIVLFGLSALGVLAGLGIVLIVRGQMLPITVIVDADARQTHTSAATVTDLLDELAIALGEYDTTTPPLDTPLSADLVVRVDRARAVSLTVDGETRIYWTTLTNPADILTSASLAFGERDRVLVDGTQTDATDLAVWPVPATHITLRHAVNLTMIDGESETVVRTTGDTVGEALFEAGVTLYLADRVSPDSTTPVTGDVEVTLYRSRPVSIIADGDTVQTRTQGDTVVDALADAGIALVGLDYTIPGEHAALRAGMHIRVIRVREETMSEEMPLSFETVFQADGERELDQRAVIQEGHEGIQRTEYRVRYENGSEIGREPGETTVIVPPQDTVIAYGTKVVIRTVDTPEGAREYWRVLRVYATSYYPRGLGGSNITASGRLLEKGVIGVDRRLIPFGTLLYVEGYGVGVAGDTGPDRGFSRWVDLGYSDADYQHWGQYVDLYILTPVPATIDYLIPE